jgi:hypothetical protein
MEKSAPAKTLVAILEISAGLSLFVYFAYFVVLSFGLLG